MAVDGAATNAWHSAGEMLMKGKTVVVTGGTSGIGEVASIALAQMGARIVLVAQNKSRAEATLARLDRSRS
jgi:NAD(P)-dependent dehydrogenase (short-subunit alcohol dehydrogenase family)